MLCCRRRRTSKPPTKNQRTEQYNNEAYEDIYDEPILRPEHKDNPPSSSLGPQEFENETYWMGSCSNPSVTKDWEPAKYENDKPQPEQRQYYNATEGIIYEEIPMSKGKPLPTKKSVPPDYEQMKVRYQNLTQPTIVGKEETDA